MRVAVFVYDWPHRKSLDTLHRLDDEGFTIGAIFAAPRVTLPHDDTVAARDKIPDCTTTEPLVFAERHGVPYIWGAHEALDSNHGCDVAVLGGARKITPHVIALFPLAGYPSGILNLHPGVLPYVRGLRAVAKAHARKKPQGCTAHLIDEDLDKGKIVEMDGISSFANPRIVHVTPGDDLVVMNERVYQAEFPLMVEALHVLERQIDG